MARRKSFAELTAQRIRISRSGASEQRMNRVNNAWNRYLDNIMRDRRFRTAGSSDAATKTKIPRSVYMGLNAG